MAQWDAFGVSDRDRSDRFDHKASILVSCGRLNVVSLFIKWQWTLLMALHDDAGENRTSCFLPTLSQQLEVSAPEIRSFGGTHRLH
jgi:hypothetical protein